MAATYRSADQNAGYVTGTSGLTINKPTGVANGDTLVAFIGAGDDAGGAYACSGWTQASGTGTGAAATTVGNDIGSTVLYKHITNAAGEPASYTFTNSDTASQNRTGFIVCVQGTDSADPIDELTQNTGTNDWTPNTVSITSGSDGCCLLFFHVGNIGTAAAKTAGAPSGTNLIGSIASSRTTSNYCSSEAAYLNQTGAGTFGATAWTGTADDSTSEWHVYSVAVRGAGKTLTETATLGHNTLKLLGIVLMEAMSLTDPTVTANKTGGGPQAYDKTLTEAATLSDTLAAGAESVTLTETLALGHETLKVKGITWTQDLSLSDTISRGRALTLTESASLSDSSTNIKYVNKELTESVGLSDTRARGVGKVWVESAGLTDTVLKGVSRTLTESAGLADNLTAESSRSKELTETVGLADTPTKGVGRTLEQFLWLLQQNLNPDGAFTTTSVTVNLSGLPPMAEVYANDLVLDPGNYGSFVVSLSSDGPWTASVRYHSVVGSMLLVYVKGSPIGGGSDIQRIAFVEVQDQSQLVEPYSETVGLTATLTKVASFYRLSAESLGLTDSIQNQYSGGSQNYTKELTEAAGLADSLTKGAERQLADSLLAGPVAWVPNPTYYSISGNSFTRTAANGTAGLVGSYEALKGYGWVQFTAAQSNKNSGVGFSFTVPDEANSYLDIDFFILLSNTGTAGLLRSGSFQFTLGSYTAGDVFTLQWSRWPLGGTLVSVWKNSSPSLISVIPSYPLYFYGWVFDQNASVNNVRFGVNEQLLLTTTKQVAGAVGLGGSLQFVQAKSPTESLTLAASLTRGAGHVLPQSLGLTDVLSRASQKLLTETAGLTGTVSKGESKQITNGVGLAGSLSKAESRSLLEAAGLADTLSLTQTQKQLSEQLSLSDVGETQHGGNSTKQLSDPAQLTDTFSRQVGYQRTLTESSTLGDSPKKGEGRTLTETGTLAGVVAKGLGRLRTEALGLTDSPRKSSSRVLTEGVSLADSVIEAATYLKQLTEGSTLTGSLTRGAGKQRVEAAALTGTIQKATGILLGEGVGLSDAIAFGPTRINYEGLGLTGTLAKGLGRTLAEGLAVADQTVTTQHTPYGGNSYSKTLTDAVGLTDSRTKGAGKQLTEAAALLDSLTRQAGYARTLTEGAALVASLQKGAGKVRSESLSLTASLTTGKAKILTESLGLSDLLTKQLSAARSLTETASLSDILDTTADTKILTATANLSDGIAKGLSRELTETATLLESFNTPKNLIEGVALVDTFEFGFNRTKDFLQYVPLVDTLEVVYGLAGAAPEEQLVLDDSRSVELSRVLTETLGVRSTVLAPDGYGVEEWFTFAG